MSDVSLRPIEGAYLLSLRVEPRGNKVHDGEVSRPVEVDSLSDTVTSIVAQLKNLLQERKHI